MKLNLGCCDSHVAGYVNVDRCPPADQIVDLAAPADVLETLKCINDDAVFASDLAATYALLSLHPSNPLRYAPWPWEDNSVDAIRAHDVIEHLPSPLHTMNEIWRVLKPGARIEIVVPTTEGRGADQDPTHISRWNRNSFLYYTAGIGERERFGSHYGSIARFKVIEEDEREFPGRVWKLKIVLEAVK